MPAIFRPHPTWSGAAGRLRPVHRQTRRRPQPREQRRPNRAADAGRAWGCRSTHENPLDVPANLEQDVSRFVRQALAADDSRPSRAFGFSPTFVGRDAAAGDRGVLTGSIHNAISNHILREAGCECTCRSSRRRRNSLEARRDLAQAELNLRYCSIVSEIDGVVTRRNVNPGNNVQVGQSLMAVRSLS
jgi:acetyl/propionyl-CoA carboxylase alpha subunit